MPQKEIEEKIIAELKKVDTVSSVKFEKSLDGFNGNPAHVIGDVMMDLKQKGVIDKVGTLGIEDDEIKLNEQYKSN
ncbi:MULTISPECIES: hypothetical protein [Shouchella]|uniref:Uncharacterized protein n=2 Tax=Shouchella TaxID=2893057 RepID=A0ABY7WAR6_9BACI|nr:MULTISPECIES: hypothetical protein [Shouchella]MED4126572.1 hypothetical protein [Shouchella miscanthi]WDF04724.1 hypothetical protein PQ477_04490 [Shouchella hunanensis]GAF22066.1 hypothetical protein JCM19047_1800 [Bacillus sp. JCM 19047]